jgi:transglutaminase-like putative cysteine protease
LRWRRELANLGRRLLNLDDLLILLVLAGLLAMPVVAISSAGWADDLGLMLPVMLIALALSYVLSKSQFSELSALLISTSYGIIVIGVIHALALTEADTFYGRFSELATRISDWYERVNAGGVGTDNLIFVLFMSVLFWFMAHNAAWHTFRLERVWRVIILPGIALVYNNYRYEGDANLEIYVVGYLFFAFMLIVHSHIAAREYEWFRQRVRYSSHLRRHFIRVGALMALVVLPLAWAFPTGEDRSGLEEQIDQSVLEEFNEMWRRLFSSLEGGDVATTDYYGGDRLDLTGPVQLGDREVMRISTEGNTRNVRLYWRSTAYDSYGPDEDGIWGWEHSRSVRAYKDNEGMEFNIGNYSARRTVEQEVEMLLPASSLVYAAPQPVELGLGVEAELNCVESAGPDCVNRGEQVDVSIIRAREVLRDGDDYTAASSVSVATADQLRSANINYPGWVTRSYLQGANQVSGDLRTRTQQIISAAGATNPYDKAKAIESWLRRNITYDEFIPSPPRGRDPVDWFVFDIQRGYCNYYATAMVMMLRSEGIPSRMAAGFAQGELTDGRYLVRENDAHTWVEAYFPGYGWVEFEPTADELPYEREGDASIDESQATPTPFPTFTPTASPSPSPTLTPTSPPPSDFGTPTPTATATQQIDPPPVSGITATPEPSPTPTHTPTPTASPTMEPETESISVAADDENDFWDTLLLIIAILFGLIMLMVTLGLFLLWWVEYRGLGDLNPVQRSYARLGIYGHWLGANITDRQTPDERRRNLVDEVPEGEPPINSITELYTRDRFAPPVDDVEVQRRSVDEAGHSWTQARLAFLREKMRRWFRRD